jgi:hypothetical protein
MRTSFQKYRTAMTNEGIKDYCVKCYSEFDSEQ